MFNEKYGVWKENGRLLKEAEFLGFGRKNCGLSFVNP